MGGPSRSSGTGQGKLPVVQNGLGDPPGGLGRVEGPSQRSGVGTGTLPEVQDGSGTLLKV